MRKLRRGEPTETIRSEFFSDAVFAVAITLLALDLTRIRATEGPDAQTLFEAIAHLWPVLLAFAASFATIGVTWLNHHNRFVRVKGMSRSLQVANLMLLAGVVLVPWVTANLAEALSLPGNHGQQEALVYGAVLVYQAITWFFLLNVLARHPELLEEPEYASGFAKDRNSALIGIATGAIAGLIGFYWSPIVATALFLAIPIFYAVVSEGFESEVA